MMITLSKSVGDSFQNWGELPTAVASQKTNTSHVATIFCIILQRCYDLCSGKCVKKDKTLVI
jgi:nitrite reductase/ring-hydroxylating ferredoxin subunit